jgi:hypothetical protein
MFDRLKALMLLDECTGDDIWPLEYCRDKGIPEDWLDEMADSYESGFQSERQKIYYEDRLVNQFHGVHDRDLAFKLAEFLGVDTVAATRSAFDRRTEVRALKEAVEEL